MCRTQTLVALVVVVVVVVLVNNFFARPLSLASTLSLAK